MVEIRRSVNKLCTGTQFNPGPADINMNGTILELVSKYRENITEDTRAA